MTTSEGTTGAPQTLYGEAAAIVGLALVWFATWTALCNAVVLAGLGYGTVFPWALLIPTGITGLVGWGWWRRLAASYQFSADTFETGGSWRWLMAAFGLSAVVAGLAWARQDQALLFIAGSALIGYILCTGTAGADRWAAPERSDGAAWRVIVFFLALLAIYYLGHRPDEDDAVFVNLAVGAQRTSGAVYELDTMMGDGPSLLHLPTYKFHSLELLAASVSSLTGLEPIAVSHLLLPLPQLALISLIFYLILLPVGRRYWLVAALLWVAFLLATGRSYSSWGAHGIFRLIHGKAFLVAALVPLIAALTVRWFRCGKRIDLVGLGLAQTCAIGFSANGIYVGPAASGFVAAAFIAAAPGTAAVWQRALSLLPTLAYPAMMTGAIAAFDLARPSQLTDVFLPLQQLAEVAGGAIGWAVIPAILLGGLGLAHTSFHRPGFIYIPLCLALTCNPLGWHLISEATGNLGFRIFWAVPVPVLSALAGLWLMRRLGLRSEPLMLLVAAGSLAAAGAFNTLTGTPRVIVRWHLPDLKVNRPDFDLAGELAGRTDASCRILAPERIATWLPTMRGAPYPVYAREVYILYPFTLPADERAMRIRLRQIVEGDGSIAPPSASVLARYDIPIGTIAVDEASQAVRSASALAEELDLPGPTQVGDLLVWSGPCRRG